MVRIKFRKSFQRKFIDEVLIKTNCPSLRELIRRGFDINYQTLKSYYFENRTLSEELFNNLLEFAKIDKKKIKFEIVDENFGQIKGGKKSRRN